MTEMKAKLLEGSTILAEHQHWFAGRLVSELLLDAGGEKHSLLAKIESSDWLDCFWIGKSLQFTIELILFTRNAAGRNWLL